MAILLKTLMQSIEYKLIGGNEGIRISEVVSDTRKVKKDCLFVAIKGGKFDAHQSVEKVISAGATCVVVNSKRDFYSDDDLVSLAKVNNVSIISVRDSRKAYAEIVAAFHAHPEDRMDLVGVTGTKGKTTTTFMIHDILNRDDHGSGLIGTVCNMIGDEIRASKNTTPEAGELFGMLDEMAQRNFDSCVMEVSSLGLKQDRVHGIRFDIGCFTNLSKDHVGGDEHPTIEDYFTSKLKMFDNCRVAVVNKDCSKADEVINYASKECDVYTFGMSEDCDCYASNLRQERRGSTTGTIFDLVSPWYEGEVYVNLPGEFNVYNALCAISVAGILKVGFDRVKDGLAHVYVPGRAQVVDNNLDISILVDYAHEGESLKSVLKTMKEYTSGNLISIFGCGGNRPPERRYQMGEMSGLYADYSILTSDNPRDEEPENIIKDIVTGMSKTDGKYEIVVDRAQAIERGIRMAKPGDLIIIAGKGHENYQEFANKLRIHFDDSEVAGEIVRKIEEERA